MTETFKKIEKLCEYIMNTDALYSPEIELVAFQKCHSYIMEECGANDWPSIENIILKIEKEITEREKEIKNNQDIINNRNNIISLIIKELADEITNGQV
jgi:hypothetical protein